MIRAALLLLALALPAPVSAADCVVLLHGLARGKGSMAGLETVLSRRGYRVVNADYPSTSTTIEALAAHVGEAVQGCGTARVHFVTHSLGGILVRVWMRDHRPARMGRVVMLGPPNGGSELVDELGGIPGFELWNGPAGKQLGTDAASLPSMLPPVDYPVGVIAGTQSVNPLYSNLIPGPDDGKVGLGRTRVEGMADHIALPVTHTFMMWDPEVIAQVLTFLATGAFDASITRARAIGMVLERPGAE